MSDKQIYKIHLLDVSMKMCQVQTVKEIMEGHRKTNEESPALYPIDKSVIKTYSLSAGQYDVCLDNIFNGVIPNHVYVGLVANAAYTGSFKRNPFNFRHYDLHYMCFCINGVPVKIFRPDFEQDLYLEPYVSLFGNKFLNDEDIDVTRKDYKSGYAIYRLNVRDDNKSKWLLSNYGTMRLELKFTKPLPEIVSVIVYAKFEGLISVDSNALVSYK
jgi:hypothetical protein